MQLCPCPFWTLPCHLNGFFGYFPISAPATSETGDLLLQKKMLTAGGNGGGGEPHLRRQLSPVSLPRGPVLTAVPESRVVRVPLKSCHGISRLAPWGGPAKPCGDGLVALVNSHWKEQLQATSTLQLNQGKVALCELTYSPRDPICQSTQCFQGHSVFPCLRVCRSWGRCPPPARLGGGRSWAWQPARG